MRLLFNTALGAVSLFVISCQQGADHQHTDAANAAAKDTTAVVVNPPSETKSIAPRFASIDAKLSNPLHQAVGYYLDLKNALVGEKSDEAKEGAAAMVKSLESIDKSYFTAEQKKAYDDVEKGLKEHAGQIAATADIKLQRAHFVDLSNNVYELVKAFGAGKTVFHDYCPMANDDKGALWVSEVADIKNPYFGSAMLTCGSVEEKIN